MVEGIVVQAGKWDNISSIAVLEVSGMEKAERRIREDPLVISGLIDYEIGRFLPLERD